MRVMEQVRHGWSPALSATQPPAPRRVRDPHSARECRTHPADPDAPRPFLGSGRRRRIRRTPSRSCSSPPAEKGARFAFAPGQFSMLYVSAWGRSPISMSGDPVEPERVLHTTRVVGTVTRWAAGALTRRCGGDPWSFGTPVADQVDCRVMTSAPAGAASASLPSPGRRRAPAPLGPRRRRPAPTGPHPRDLVAPGATGVAGRFDRKGSR